MGAWAHESFENDDAMDWVGDLLKSDGTGSIAVALDQVLAVGDDYLEAPDASMGLAAAQVVAALMGKPAAKLPEEVTSLAFRKFVPLCRQGLSGIGPSVRMGEACVVIDQVVEDPSRQVGLGAKVAATDYSALQDAKPDFNLVQPATMLGREMDHVFVFRIGQESTPFCSVAKFFRLERNVGQTSDASAHA